MVSCRQAVAIGAATAANERRDKYRQNNSPPAVQSIRLSACQLLYVLFFFLALVNPTLAQGDGATPAQGPTVPCDAFRKISDGSWTALRDVNVTLGSAQVSAAATTTYRHRAINVNGVDFADFLDGHCSGPLARSK